DVAYAADAAADLLGDHALLFGGGGDLLVHRLDVGNPLVDATQRGAGLARHVHAVAGQGVAAVQAAGHALGTALQAGDQLFDFLGGLLGALGQGAHFVGDHGEPATGLAGTSGLDGGVQSQQVGLLGYRLDHVHDAADLVAFLLQLGHGLGGAADLLGQTFDLGNDIIHHLVTLAGFAFRLVGRPGRQLGVARHILHSGGHLVHGGGHLVGFFLLLADAGAGLLGDHRQLLGGAGDLRGAVTDAANQGAQGAGHVLDAALQRAQLVAAGDPGFAGQVAIGDAF